MGEAYRRERRRHGGMKPHCGSDDLCLPEILSEKVFRREFLVSGSDLELYCNFRDIALYRLADLASLREEVRSHFSAW